MVSSLTKDEIYTYMKHQIDMLFYDKYKFEGNGIRSAIDLALDRLEYCFRHIAIKNYRTENGDAMFHHLHGDQYAQFLYYFADSLWKLEQNRPICDKIIQLNRALHNIFVTYYAGLPDIFVWVHPIGTVLGNAEYSNYFACNQECNVATKVAQDGRIPKVGSGLYLGAGARLLDNHSDVGDRVMIGAGTQVFNIDIPDDSLVIHDRSGALQVRPHDLSRYMEQMKNVFVIDETFKKYVLGK